ncbi:MAG: hypothetical protein ABSH25_16335 [Syntrophorhabdales bacterium]
MGRESERIRRFQEKEMSERLLTKDGSNGGRKGGGRSSWGGIILIIVVLVLFAAGCATGMGSIASRSAGASKPAIDYRGIEPMGNPGIWVDGHPQE